MSKLDTILICLMKELDEMEKDGKTNLPRYNWKTAIFNRIVEEILFNPMFVELRM